MTSKSAALRTNGRVVVPTDMRTVLDEQRRAFLAAGPPSAATRIDRIDRVIDLIVSNADALVDALVSDYGHRSRAQSMLSDVVGPLPAIKHTRKNVRGWMKPTRYGTGAMRLAGARAWVDWQPLGVVGVISPWNFPVGLTFDPVTQAFAAGNAVMVKLSEFVPETSELMRVEIAKRFDDAELRAFTGGPDVGAEFGALPFDHLLLTGSPGTGRHVQRAAADNLVPVTLELGGKSPVVISPNADLKAAADRIMVGKTMNAGQLCLSPDYVLIPEEKQCALVEHVRASVGQMFPRILDNDDYTSIVNERHFDRIHGLIEDARAKGAQIIEINPASEDFSRQGTHKIAPTLVLGPTKDMRIMAEEIFGPVLPIATYANIDDAIEHINAGPKPLAAYYFGPDDEARQRFLARTYSGGVTINDVTLHYTVAGMPFGGVGESGMGYYHGRSGFETFSHARGVMKAPSRFSLSAALAAPYTGVKQRGMRAMIVLERQSVRRRLRKQK
ncbi:MAG: coniferyl-aldehyde dehydrogenase [Mycobacterium sp.]|jgi:coniferyl-aldehyde dehydrogenase|nr:coniferyl-aldehyde dehydrogenase [Mycobacterium sp.]